MPLNSCSWSLRVEFRMLFRAKLESFRGSNAIIRFLGGNLALDSSWRVPSFGIVKHFTLQFRKLSRIFLILVFIRRRPLFRLQLCQLFTLLFFLLLLFEPRPNRSICSIQGVCGIARALSNFDIELRNLHRGDSKRRA